jgi:hypothetical protein
MRVRLPAGVATAIGALPHTDVDDAVTFVLERAPRLPFAPRLPRRSPLEGKVAQVVHGVPGVSVEVDGSVTVDSSVFDPGAVDASTPLDADAFTGALAVLDALKAAEHRGPVKLQLGGPVTVGLAFIHAGVRSRDALTGAAHIVASRAHALIAAARDRLPDSPLVVLLDEPGLAAAGHPGFPLDSEPTIDLLSGALAAIEPAISGVHCCSGTEWSTAVQAGASVLSMPLEPGVVDDANLLSTFLDVGGWIAWGAVPVTGPVGPDPDPLWRRLTGVWCDLTRAGVDPLQLRKHSLVTPACGLDRHGPSQAELAMDLCGALADRVHDQALATRLSVGA